MCQSQLIWAHGLTIEWAYPQPPTFPWHPKPGIEKSPFQVSAKPSEMCEIRRYSTFENTLAPCGVMQLYIFLEIIKDRVQYVESSSGLITIVVMSLLFSKWRSAIVLCWFWCYCKLFHCFHIGFSSIYHNRFVFIFIISLVTVLEFCIRSMALCVALVLWILTGIICQYCGSFFWRQRKW